MGYNANTLSNIAPILIKDGLQALRENTIAARLCQFDVSAEAAQKNQKISVVLPYAIPAAEVTVGTANTPTAMTPTVVDVTLGNWWEARFQLSDKEMGDVTPGHLPRQASEAIKSLANKVDATILALYKDVYGQYGTAGTTPSTGTALANVRKVLNKQLCPLDNRVLLINPDAEASFLSQTEFTSYAVVGETQAQREGSLGRKYGFDIYMSQNMPSHTVGDMKVGSSGSMTSCYGTAGIKVATAVTGNAYNTQTSIVLKGSNATGTAVTGSMLVGDIFTISGVTGCNFVVSTSATSATATDTITIVFQPGIPAGSTAAQNAAVTLIDSHSVNLAFNTQAFCFVSRPLENVQGLGNIIETAVDPLSGISLRLEISRNEKMTIWSYDILWGIKTIRPALAARLLG